MGFLEHLEELRKKIIISLIVLTITTGISYFFAHKILSLILIPAGNISLVYLSPLEPFIVRTKLALFLGICLSLPIILYETISFLAPGLTKREKKILLVCLFVFFFLFISGCLFSFFFILPYTLKWLFSQAAGYLTLNIRADYYIMFVGWFILMFGLVFETPFLIILLLKLKICTYKSLRAQWRIVYLGTFIISSLITPDWNPATMFLMAIPLVLLYEATLFIGFVFKLR